MRAEKGEIDQVRKTRNWKPIGGIVRRERPPKIGETDPAAGVVGIVEINKVKIPGLPVDGQSCGGEGEIDPEAADRFLRGLLSRRLYAFGSRQTASLLRGAAWKISPGVAIECAL